VLTFEEAHSGDCRRLIPLNQVPVAQEGALTIKWIKWWQYPWIYLTMESSTLGPAAGAWFGNPKMVSISILH